MVQMGAKLVVKNWQQFSRDLDKADKHRIKSAETATKRMGFLLMKALKAELKKGAPGGRTLSPLSEIARRIGKGAMSRRPLSRLATPIRYWSRRTGGKLEVSVGFPETGASKSWLKIAKLQQEGGTVPIKEERRKALAAVGAKLKAGKKTSAVAKYFFLKPTTTSVKVPARPIIEPFWRKHQRRAATYIQRLFERKMRGERI